MSRENRRPFFQKGDLVTFDFDNGKQKIHCEGIVVVIDVFRIGQEVKSIEYDIYGDDYSDPQKKCLYKHVDECCVIKLLEKTFCNKS
ncbi:MAG: hypothetical protein U0K86_07515 [Agathobacter sp.]|nr:hypothetical protein [Agathobacter sp.]